MHTVGLGEACAHIAALLFAVEVQNRLKYTSCTSEPYKWLSLTMQNVPYALISDIVFTTPATKRRRILEGTSGKLSQSDISLPSPCPILLRNCLRLGNLLFYLSYHDIAKNMLLITLYYHSHCLAWGNQMLWTYHIKIYSRNVILCFLI